MQVLAEVETQLVESRRERAKVQERIATAEDRLRRIEQAEQNRRSGDERRLHQRRRGLAS